MSAGVGGKTEQAALIGLVDMAEGVDPIHRQEFESRLGLLRASMKAQGFDAAFLHASSNLLYFTGLPWHPSERMVAAVVFTSGDLVYIAPHFEADTLRDYWLIESELQLWHEHEQPSETLGRCLQAKGLAAGSVLVDPATPYCMVDAIIASNPDLQITNAAGVFQSIRCKKSSREIELIQRSHEMTLQVLKAAASILRTGISTVEVTDFIDRAHKAVGAEGSTFCIVLFGVATSFPHGVKNPQTLKDNDWVLIDTGCLLHGYHSDITRTFPFGKPTDRQIEAWNAEQAAQLAAFQAAIPGQPCEQVDAAARASLEAAGYGPDYSLPGLPHRTGHGCGLDIHESPNLVRGEKTLLSAGMVFSNEPMLVIPGEFGVRLEDHFHITPAGAKWFTQPSHSIDEPFGIDA